MSTPVKTILHADLDAFFASVAQRDDPSLRGKPVSVGGGVVMAASYEARACGVRSGMGGRKARQLCPELVVVSPSFDSIVQASKDVMAILERYGDRVEKASIDEAFLDVTPRDGETVAREIRRAVREEVGLPISVGVAPSRTVAKVASGMAKPDGLVVVEPDGLFDFLHPLPVGKLWGVGPATQRRLQQHGIRTVADAARVGDGVLVTILGRSAGRRLDAIAHGREIQTVRHRQGRRSYGAQRALSRSRPTDLDEALVGLVERIARRMAGRGQAGRTVVLRLRFGDFTKATRSRSLPRATCDPDAMVAVARALLAEARPVIAQRGCTLIGVSLSGIEAHDDAQLVLPFADAA